MKLIPIILFIIIAAVSIISTIYAFAESKIIFYGQNTSLSKKIKNSILNGFSIAGISFSIILLLGIVDQNYIWSIQIILSALLISLLLGVFVTIGSFIQFSIARKYRNIIKKKIINDKKE